MAITLSQVAPHEPPGPVVGGLKARIYKATFTASDYPTGGYAVAASAVGLSAIVGVLQIGLDNAAITAGAYWLFNATTGKLQAFGSNGIAPAQLAEIANATDLILQKPVLLFLGT